MRPRLATLGLAALFILGPAVISAQAQGPASGLYYGPGSYYGPPGNWGVAFGTASYGVPRTYSEYSSSYGPGYAYGYGPSLLLPGRHGVGLWRPDFRSPGDAYGAGYYWTFPASSRPRPAGLIPPSVGYYAPGFGPPPMIGN